MRQSIIGLFIFLSLGLLGWLVLWLRNFSLGDQSYNATIQFENVGGMTPGTIVQLRGVKIGQIVSVNPDLAGVDVDVEIWPATRLIPTNSLIETNQAGLVGETSINIVPLQSTLPDDTAPPLSPDCNPDMIICDGSRLQGQSQLDVNALIRSLLRISDSLSDPENVATFRSIAENTASAVGEVATLGNELTSLLQDVEDTGTVGNVNELIISLDQTLGELRGVVQGDTAGIGATLDSIQQTSNQLQATLQRLDPVLDDVAQGEILANVETLSANAAEASVNLREFSANLNGQNTTVLLQETLDSARELFENLRKITADVDELTGNPEFRNDIEELIEGLRNLVSSTQHLQQGVLQA